jgi:hypothetical protein
MLSGVVAPKLKVGRFCAPVGLEVMAAVRPTMPVKPPAGVTEIVDVFPAVAPRAKVTVVPLTVKTGIVIVSFSVVDVLGENSTDP